MDAFEKKTLKTSRGYTYTYYVADGDKSLPALFFQHGWPDHAAMWKDIATPLRSTKHPIIIPDLLGYDGTDKPTDPAAYRWDVMTKDLIEIVDAEQHEKIISVGHDWGAGCASRLYNFYPNRVDGVVLLNVAYGAPTRDKFDLDAVNKMTEKAFGYPVFSYWHLFTAPDGPAVLKEHLERLYHAMHGEAETMKYIFTTPGAIRDYLLNGGHESELRPYARDEKLKQEFIDRMTRDGFEGPQCWYRATTENYQSEAHKQLPEGAEKVNVPLLYIGCKQDPVCRPETMYSAIKAGLLPKLEQAEMIDAAHWVAYEKPEEVVVRMEGWLKKHYAQE
ncbi:alpha/beta-hydrolase [Dothidotthia symphoricarpi CBS 119687]|uniref:Alpha/beta-hydrolase n=1 Tax=Dothidotthia symphoricarpi CBS 119687 TaxID=1392245 RepID=A0A6A6A629_9PLEO|nr:alpha/beta-hydrolase [Dothidotthia symphoricarpi CBS 119687]KAF2126228.1 alpha/beta-hydrolase [Dothidotthia symphoricarpi CBS 119687]